MIAAVRVGGAIAGAVVKGPMDGDVFIVWVREALLPGLRPGDIVVMDNLPAHKRPAVRAMILFQYHTGCRPSEVCLLKGRKINRDSKVWVYRPRRHKTAHQGKKRRIFIGPRAQGLEVYERSVRQPPASRIARAGLPALRWPYGRSQARRWRPLQPRPRLWPAPGV